jgi:hypothetical protein
MGVLLFDLEYIVIIVTDNAKKCKPLFVNNLFLVQNIRVWGRKGGESWHEDLQNGKGYDIILAKGLRKPKNKIKG